LDPTGVKVASPDKLRARSEPLRIERLKDRSQAHIDYLLDTGRQRGQPVVLDSNQWTIDSLSGPNVTDKESVLSLAKIAANAYVTNHNDAEWFDVGNGFNYTDHFGWENDGLRGHVFADETNRTIIIGLKGTSPAVFDGEGTTHQDKVNDNLFFSCCCGQGGKYGWLQVCDCQTDAFTCNSTCVVSALKNKNRYYYAAQEIYRNVSIIYPDADIWMVGHSLGGSTASLVALTYGVPVVTFEAPGEAMPAKRLGLPTPPGYHLGAHQERVSTGGFHFGHTADPIFMGICNTYSSVCTIAGYAMQSVCHTGSTCTYDTVGDLGWRVGAGTHKIVSVIRDVLEKYAKVAVCKPYSDCTDCFDWTYFESNHSDHSTTKTKPPTTSTSTCETPGWFGCLDSSTSSTTTSTCKTPGWFGCKDKTTDDATSMTTESQIHTTITSVTTSTTTTTSYDCETPGWFGCNDPSTVSHAPKPPAKTSNIASETKPQPPRPTKTSPPEERCVKRTWLGWCKKWEAGDKKVEWEL
jgi:lipase ATG15